MAKVIPLVTNGDVQQWCGRKGPQESGNTPPQRIQERVRSEEAWLPMGIPALTDPHASHLWAQVLRHVVQDPFPVTCETIDLTNSNHVAYIGEYLPADEKKDSLSEKGDDYGTTKASS